MILSGGGGERLGVLSAERAVSALPFGGKYRVIDFSLSNCCHSGIGQVGVLAQHAPASLNDHIGAGRPWDLDRRSGGVVILQPYQTRSHAGWYRGTADAITQNWDYLEERRPERVLVLSGDHVYRMDYRALFLAHEQRGAAVTLAVTRVPADQTRRFGMVTTDRGGRVRTLEEKPERSAATHASMGIYVFEFEVLGEMLRTRPVDLVLDVLRPLVDAGERVYAHEFNGFWEDVGTVASYYRASMELVQPEPRFQLHDARWPILTRDEERPAAIVSGNAQIEDSLIANGCRIDGQVQRSILFPGVSVGRGATITDAVVMADTVIEPGARVDRALLDKYVRVGESAIVGEGEERGPNELSWLSNLVLVGKDTWIPPGGRVMRPAQLGVGGRYEDFVDGVVPSGTLVGNRRWFEELR
ncbi:MAG: glucose-1-phosphate adenylyltransferase [Candidatus Eisenbacteria bacterium]|uniref:Glucose-1-phosphate adenylyltransferase n=1 Tax=Eiseniibacteriota bacterium TaxID=2212470 RepID=A0A933SEJ7_UNCEI|nr:glucose-1-phosphate adenylyltransferase [Candidatus Eisenbacteria bacterium]